MCQCKNEVKSKKIIILWVNLLKRVILSTQNHSLAEALFDTVASDNKGGVTNLDTDGILDKLSEIERLLEDRKRHGVIKDKLDSLRRDVEERSITEEKSGRSFVNSEESYSKTNVNSEVESLREGSDTTV